MALLDELSQGRQQRLVHARVIPARDGRHLPWPPWVSAELIAWCTASGIDAPWGHQVAAANWTYQGEHVVLATGTASGKSLAYAMAAADVVAGGGTVLYLSPTKALAHDQLNWLEHLPLTALRPAAVDGDADGPARSWARAHGTYLLSNPDFLHHSMLARHQWWAGFLRRLSLIVIDESHAYRGVFGAHVALVMRRLLRICDHYGAHPSVFACSASVANPQESLQRLIGAPAQAVTADDSPSPQRTIAFWEPELTDAISELDAPIRRSATAECGELLADLTLAGARTLAFVRSRGAAESVAQMAKDIVAEVDPDAAQTIAAYRGGFLPEERRALEEQLRSGTLRSVATTSALELGIDISTLDAVVCTGWPGTRASLWQQFGRAGRADAPALDIFIARDEPLDRYVVEHPETVLDTPVEAQVFNPENPNVLAPHLCAAASELPLTATDAARWFCVSAPDIAAHLAEQGLLRARPTGWYWVQARPASELADLRGSGSTVQLVESGTGRLLGTVDGGSAHAQVHDGAIYSHQGSTFIVSELDVAHDVAICDSCTVDYYTQARQQSSIAITDIAHQVPMGRGHLATGSVQVSSQVVSFAKRRRMTGEFLGEQALALPAQHLQTTAVWWTLPADLVDALDCDVEELGGAAHAAEHASIGLLPLFATCDRWDIGGVSTNWHADTGALTVFVYDGLAGGAGFAEYGFDHARTWLGATATLIAQCPCAHGCPACIQSPKCGNGNNPLNKSGAVQLLSLLLD